MAGLMGFLRGLFGGAKGPQEGKTTGHAGLSEDAARAALSELTGGGAATLRLFDAAIAGNLPKNRPFDPGDDGQVSMGVAIMAALHAARRAVCLDWAEGAQVACTAFGQHFGPLGIRAH